MSLQDDGRKAVGGLRSRLGFRSKKQKDNYDDYDDYADDYGDDYADDYGDDYADDYGDDYGELSNDPYDPYDSYGDQNSVYDDYSSDTARLSRSRMSNTSPRLVSFKDVQENISVSNDARYADASSHYGSSAGEDAASSSNFFGRTMVDSSLPPQMTPEGTAEAARKASSGLDSLFAPTDDSADYDAPAAPYADQQAAPARQAAPTQQAVSTQQNAPVQSSAASPSYTDNFDARTSFDSFAKPQRMLCVLKLVSYREVEKVVDALQNDEVVILQLRNAPERVFPRILDFSFGAACALGAAVECVGERTFAISRSGALTDAERIELHGQGVL